MRGSKDGVDVLPLWRSRGKPPGHCNGGEPGLNTSPGRDENYSRQMKNATKETLEGTRKKINADGGWGCRLVGKDSVQLHFPDGKKLQECSIMIWLISRLNNSNLLGRR